MALRTLGLFSKFLAILILSAVTSPLPVRRQVPEDRECNFNITEPEAQNIICLRDALDSAVPEITRFVRMEFVDHDDIYFDGLRNWCQFNTSGMPVHQKFYVIRHYVERLEATGYPDFSSELNQTVGLLKETLPRLNETVMNYCTCESDDCTVDDVPTIDLGSMDSLHPYCYFGVITKVYSSIYTELRDTFPESSCPVCKRPDGVSSCGALALGREIPGPSNFTFDESCGGDVISYCGSTFNSDLENVLILKEVLRNQTKLPSLAGSDVVTRLNTTLSAMESSLRKVCNDGRCEEDCSNVTSTSLTTYLETFYNEADGCSERMEEICLLNVLGTFKELYRKMVDDFYFQECMG